MANFAACSAGLIILVSVARIPVAASAVLTPPFVINASAPPNSANVNPAAAANGATVPIEFDSSPNVVIPSLTVVNKISDACCAVNPDLAYEFTEDTSTLALVSISTNPATAALLAIANTLSCLAVPLTPADTML